MTNDDRRPEPKGRGAGRNGPAVAALLVLIAVFVALGVWQVQRRAWKHELIAAVNARTTAAPVAAPDLDQWPLITQQRDAYRRVTVQGRFLTGKDTLVQAVTELGGGYWVVTPLDTGRFTVLINRGFVPQDRKRGYAPAPPGVVRVTGLLRVTEPGGGFLRSNKPATDQWYSRDVAAIAATHGLNAAAPYFIDADAALDVSGGPRGGLTVVRFSDNHLMYALTWFGMALLSAWAIYYVRRQGAGVRGRMEGDTDPLP